MNEFEGQLYNVYNRLQVDALLSEKDINFIDLLCKSRGWKPMKKEEEITVHMSGNEYKIKRTK